MPLSSARLTDMRGRANNFLADSCVIENNTRSADGEGGYATSWAVQGTVACYLEAITKPMRGGDVEQFAGRVASEIEYALYIAAEGTIAQQDRVTIGNVIYTVEAVVSPTTRRAFTVAKVTREV